MQLGRKVKKNLYRKFYGRTAGLITPDEIGIPYATLELKNRFISTTSLQQSLEQAQEIQFSELSTERFAYIVNTKNVFDTAFLLEIIQSSLYQDGQQTALTSAKKLYIPDVTQINSTQPLIAIINHRTHNIISIW